MNFSFYTDGADPLAHLDKHTQKYAKPVVEGIWSVVSIRPNLFSPQSFIVGVIVQSPIHGTKFKLIDSLKKFDCIYEKSMKEIIANTMRAVEYSLSRIKSSSVNLNEVVLDQSNIEISKPWVTSGASLESILDRLFEDVVAMKETTVSQVPTFATLDNTAVRRMVSDELKRIASTSYERIVIEDQPIFVEDVLTGQRHELDINLKTEKGIGSVISAVYKTENLVELNVLRVSHDLSVYGKKEKLTDLAVFVMAAKESSFTKKEYLKFSSLLDEQSWKLTQQGFRVVTFDNPVQIAEDILEWSGI